MPHNPNMDAEYIVVAWAYKARDEPAWSGDNMMEVVWDADEAERLRQRGGYEPIQPLYAKVNPAA